MTNKESNLISKCKEINNEIEEYIASNNDWVYYFLNPLAGSNEELFNVVKENPDDWGDYVTFAITNVTSTGIVNICINIDDDSELGVNIRRCIILSSFSDTVAKNKKLYEGKLNDIRKNNLEEEIEYYEKLLAKKKEELKQYN